MDNVLVIEACTRDPISLNADDTCAEARKKLTSDEKYKSYDGFHIVALLHGCLHGVKGVGLNTLRRQKPGHHAAYR